MHKVQLKLLVVLLVSALAVSCFAGCSNTKDVYGAASDYIKVSHPDKPNKNAFSEEEDVDSPSKDNSVSGNSDASDTSADKAQSSDKSNSNDNTSTAENTSSGDGVIDNSSSGETVTVEGNGSDLQDITYDPSGGDYGPVVTF